MGLKSKRARNWPCHVGTSVQLFPCAPVVLMEAGGSCGVSKVEERTSMSSRGIHWGSCRGLVGEGSRFSRIRAFRLGKEPTIPSPDPPVLSSPPFPEASSLICHRSLHHFCPKTLSRMGTQSWATVRTACLSLSTHRGGRERQHWEQDKSELENKYNSYGLLVTVCTERGGERDETNLNKTTELE